MPGNITPGPDPAIGYISGGYYGAANVGQIGTIAATTLTLGRCYYAAFPVYRVGTFDRIGIEVTTGGSATCALRLGIYNGAGGVPTSVLLDAGTVDGTTTGAKEITISQTLARGYYFLALAVQGAGGVATKIREEQVYNLFHFSMTSPTTQMPGFFQGSMGSGALVAYTNGTSGNIGHVPNIKLRAA